MLAAALAKMAQRGNALLLDETGPEPEMRTFDDRHERRERRLPSAEPVPLRDFPDMKMVRYRLAVGHRDGVKPGQIVGAIANEADMDSKYIGEISIFDSFSTVDLPEGMPEETKRVLAAARVCGRALDLREYTAEPPRRRPPRHFDAPRREDFADEGEYRHEPGDINGNSIDYDPRRSRRDFRPRRNDYDRRSSFNLDFNRPRRNGGMRRNGFRRDGF